MRRFTTKIYNKMDLKQFQKEFPDIAINSPDPLLKYLSTYVVALDFLTLNIFFLQNRSQHPKTLTQTLHCYYINTILNELK